MSIPRVAAGSRVDEAVVRPGSVPETSRIRNIIAATWLDALAFLVAAIVFLVPFSFIVLTAAKTQQEASLAQFSWPSPFQLIQNLRDVLVFGNGLMLRCGSSSARCSPGWIAVTVISLSLRIAQK